MMAAGNNGARDNLLSSITEGKKLRTVDASEIAPKKAAPQNDILSAIRRGSTLKKLDVTVLKAKPPPKENLGGFGKLVYIFLTSHL